MSNIINTMKNVVMADDKTVFDRRNICGTCEHLRVGFVSSCKKCGCPIKSKTALKNSSCPIGKW